MFSSPYPVGKRPELKQVPSSKWSISHLVSTKQMKTAQFVPASPARRSSPPPRSPRQEEHEFPSNLAGETPISEDSLISPVNSIIGSTTTIERPEAFDWNKNIPAFEFYDGVSTIGSESVGDPATTLKEQPTGAMEGPIIQEAARPYHQAEGSLSPGTTLIPTATGMVRPSGRYCAMPKIMIHKPTNSSVSEASEPRTIDQVLASERQAESLTTIPPVPISPLTPTWRLPDVASATPAATGNLAEGPIGAPGLPDVSKPLRQKKRARYKWRARNIAARHSILKATLGRQLAGPTKQALRSLAKGEPVALEVIRVVA